MTGMSNRQIALVVVIVVLAVVVVLSLAQLWITPG